MLTQGHERLELSPGDPRCPSIPHPDSALSFLPQNVTANHRINDSVANEDGPQVLTGRFMYGPLDMVTLTGEKVRTRGNYRAPASPPSGWGVGMGRPGDGQLMTSLPGLPGGCAHHGAAALGGVAAPGHTGDQQQWACLLHHP